MLGVCGLVVSVCCVRGVWVGGVCVFCSLCVCGLVVSVCCVRGVWVGVVLWLCGCVLCSGCVWGRCVVGGCTYMCYQINYFMIQGSLEEDDDHDDDDDIVQGHMDTLLADRREG